MVERDCSRGQDAERAFDPPREPSPHRCLLRIIITTSVTRILWAMQAIGVFQVRQSVDLLQIAQIPDDGNM